MKTWEEIVLEKKVESTLYDLIIKSLEYLVEKEQNSITHFELFCNIKYVQIQLSVNTANHNCNADEQNDSQNWNFYQFSTDYEYVRDLWRNDWAEVMNYICDDIYLEYLDFSTDNQELADERLLQIEQGLKRVVESTFDTVKAFLNQKWQTENPVFSQLKFQEKYY